MNSSAYFGVIRKYSVLEDKYVKIIIAVHAKPPDIVSDPISKSTASV